jgi:uracil-DNA glycosylase
MKSFAFVGQAMPKPPYPDQPFGRTKLYLWFESIGISEEYITNYFHFSALVSYFPGSKNGSHIVPSEKDILAELPLLKTFLDKTKPDVIVPIGKLAIGECLQQKIKSLEDIIGNKYFVDAFGLLGIPKTIIPLPHPSGASTWFYQDKNKKLLHKALLLLKSEL